MTHVARDKPKTIVSIPSYAETLIEMEDFLGGKRKLDKPGTVQESHADRTGQDASVDLTGDATYVDITGLEDYVDLTESTKSSAIELREALDPDATDISSSSSFGDTTSRDAITSATSDAEVESEFHDDNGLGSMFNSGFTMRKKRPTTHWRNFIRPLMWRCKWTELKIKELESQALKYTRELEPSYQTKMLELQQHTSDFCSKAFPFVSHTVRKKVFKRKKRKPVENVTDISSYVSQHNLFSYLENKKSDPDSVAIPEDDCNKDLCSKNDEFGVDDDWLKDDEDPMEQVLRQIESVQSQVQMLRNHLDMVMLKYGVKFSSSDNLSLLVPYDGQTSAVQSPAFSTGNGDNMSLDGKNVPQRMSDFDIGDLVVPEGIVPGYVDGNQIPDVIESTVGLLSAADVTMHHPHILDSAENIFDDTLMQITVKEEGNMCNGVAVKVEGSICNGVTDHSPGDCQDQEMKDQDISNLPAIKPDPEVIDDSPLENVSTLKSCVTSDGPLMNKKKRGERKAAPGGWNLKCSGEPDSN